MGFQVMKMLGIVIEFAYLFIDDTKVVCSYNIYTSFYHKLRGVARGGPVGHGPQSLIEWIFYRKKTGFVGT